MLCLKAHCLQTTTTDPAKSWHWKHMLPDRGFQNTAWCTTWKLTLWALLFAGVTHPLPKGWRPETSWSQQIKKILAEGRGIANTDTPHTSSWSYVMSERDYFCNLLILPFKICFKTIWLIFAGRNVPHSMWPLTETPITALSLGYAVCIAELVIWLHKYTVLTHCPAHRRRVYIYFTKYRAVVSCKVIRTSLLTLSLKDTCSAA